MADSCLGLFLVVAAAAGEVKAGEGGVGKGTSEEEEEVVSAVML